MLLAVVRVDPHRSLELLPANRALWLRFLEVCREVITELSFGPEDLLANRTHLVAEFFERIRVHFTTVVGGQVDERLSGNILLQDLYVRVVAEHVGEFIGVSLHRRGYFGFNLDPGTLQRGFGDAPQVLVYLVAHCAERVPLFALRVALDAYLLR